ncbi:DNA adenine methylase [Solitalea koreensis]|uniref:site-specific DNA-methyltransferase (adenine-specific) n=1 Tax=Solitalea koreensis TaxID=543615 RepID=A0A521E6U0_9SPHI|nr:DNA adenine methylase [Solitalea koreensis]SMO79656.1 DNA adenine methylase [Solitalea koreensis]
MDFYSPLRYPGGKGKVAEYFKQIFKENLLYDGVYIEPYAGGASVALSLLFNEYASRIVINDIDRSIFSFWHSVINNTDELCQLIHDTPVTMDVWEQQKIVQKEKEQFGLLEVGFSTFFLNRTNRSGILNAGAIGGRQQLGDWKIDARFNKTDLKKRIERIALYKDKIELHNSDAVQLVNALQKTLPAKSLFYLDPPYYVKGKDLYLNFYQDSDHKQIATEISNVSQQKWIVTYDNVQQIRQLYENFRQVKYTLNYSAAQASKGEEVMIFSDNLFIAEHPSLILLDETSTYNKFEANV